MSIIIILLSLLSPRCQLLSVELYVDVRVLWRLHCGQSSSLRSNSNELLSACCLVKLTCTCLSSMTRHEPVNEIRTATRSSANVVRLYCHRTPSSWTFKRHHRAALQRYRCFKYDAGPTRKHVKFDSATWTASPINTTLSTVFNVAEKYSQRQNLVKITLVEALDGWMK